MTLYNDKYRIESTRLKGWDYSNAGIYYVTICTKDMKKFFRKIANGIVEYSNEGNIVNDEWIKCALLRNYLILDEFITMPNHFHGIMAIIVNKLKTNTKTTQRVVSTNQTLKPNSLGSILGQFKSQCTKKIKMFNTYFQWQGRFHDRIIRSEKELNPVRGYIRYNPLKWEKDEFYTL